MMRKAISNYNLLHSLRSNAVSASFVSPKVGLNRLLSTQTAEQALSDSEGSSDDDNAVMDWDNIGFNLVPTDYMYTMKCSTVNDEDDGSFTQGELSRYGNLNLSPAAGVLNYGQGLFEGMKAYRREDGRIALFRPDQNALRMSIGAERMCMPCPSVEQFVDAVKQTALANKRWIPPTEKGALYLRPLLLGTGPILGLAPAPEYSFLVYASPVGNYFKDGKKLNLYVETEYDRASRGGAGGVKAITNYAPGLKPALRAKSKGFSDVLYLDSATGKYIEEVSSCNIFLVKDGVISTPTTNGTILPGITRKSIIEIALDLGYEVQERLIPAEELKEADEVFCTGTAVVVSSVGSITYNGERIVYRDDKNSVHKRLASKLLGIQNGVVEDNKGWIVEI